MSSAPPSTVRAWARENGHVVSDRGRVPAAVQRAFDEAHVGGVGPSQAPAPVDAQPFDPFAVGQPSAVATLAPAEPWLTMPPPQASNRRDGFALPALLLGIVPLFAGLLGIIFGAVSLGRIKRTGAKGRGMAITGITVGSLWLLGVVAAVVIAALVGPERDAKGAVTASGDVSVQDLKLNDCLAKMPAAATLTVEVVPCAQPHAASVYGTFRLAGSAFPGAAAVDRFAQGGCERRLTERFGAKAPEEYFYLFPTKASWAQGDHDVTCVVAAAPKAGSEL